MRFKVLLFATVLLTTLESKARSVSSVTTTGRSGSSKQTVRALAVTIDDLPSHGPLPWGETRLEVARRIVRALYDAGAPPTYGFVNGVRLVNHPEDAAVLDLWRSSGNPLGNHTYTHVNLAEDSAEEFESDILQNEGVIRPRMAGEDWHWFRYPFLAESTGTEKGELVHRFVRERGYKIAGVTMSFGDYLWNEPYGRCSARSDQQGIALLERSYLEAARVEAEYRVQWSQAKYGRTIPFVLLLHVGAFDARMLPRLLKLYKTLGFTLVSLEAAERDPAYADDLFPKQSTAGELQEQSEGNTQRSPATAAPPVPPANLLNALCR